MDCPPDGQYLDQPADDLPSEGEYRLHEDDWRGRRVTDFVHNACTIDGFMARARINGTSDPLHFFDGDLLYTHQDLTDRL